jgi:hypothetical protein
MLMKIREEVKTQRYILEQKLGPELDDKEARLNELEQQLQSEPMSDEMLQEMQGDIRLMQNRIEELTEQQQRMIRYEFVESTAWRLNQRSNHW